VKASQNEKSEAEISEDLKAKDSKPLQENPKKTQMR
jgi:hypothetical protein